MLSFSSRKKQKRQVVPRKLCKTLATSISVSPAEATEATATLASAPPLSAPSHSLVELEPSRLMEDQHSQPVEVLRQVERRQGRSSWQDSPAVRSSWQDTPAVTRKDDPVTAWEDKSREERRTPSSQSRRSWPIL